MSIVGVGIDVVDIQRFERTLDRTPGMRTRLFTPAERQRPMASLAARFAAKEALAKALGAPADLHWQHAEVVSAADGRPSLRLSGTVAKRAAALGVTSTHVSLSHDAGIASAMVILEQSGTESRTAGEQREHGEHGEHGEHREHGEHGEHREHDRQEES